MIALTDKMREAMLIIQELLDRGELPGFREVGQHLGVGTGHGGRMCRALADRGYLSIGTAFDRKLTVLQRVERPDDNKPLPPTVRDQRAHQWTPEMEALIIDLRDRDFTYRQIRDEMHTRHGLFISVDAIAYRFFSASDRAKKAAKAGGAKRLRVPTSGLDCRKSFMNCGPCATICNLCIDYSPPLSNRQARQLIEAQNDQ